MTQQPPGPPPAGAAGYPPDPEYLVSDYPQAYSQSTSQGEQLAHAEPQHLPPAYVPGQGPLLPRHVQQRSTPIIAPVLALIGLILVAGASVFGLNFLNSSLGGVVEDPGAAPPGGETAVVAATDRPETSLAPTAERAPVETVGPAVVIQPPPGQTAEVKGTILFTRGGDIWAASGRQLRPLTNSDSTHSDSSPTWSPDGRYIYFIRTSKRETENSRPGGKYTLYPTDVMRMKADGRDKPKKIYDSLIKTGGLWFRHVLQPSVNVNGTSLAVVSDDSGGEGPVVLHVLNARTGHIRKVPVSSEGDLGHNDPAFSPDGTRIAYTYNDNQGTDGMPRIGIFTCQTRANCSQGKAKLLKPGFAHPSWSPDAKWLAVEATSGKGRDIAIINVRRGDVRVKLTDDGDSFAPAVSPDGDQIAYLKRHGIDIDLHIMTLDIDDHGKITLVDDQAVTIDGGVDGESTPSWYIPADQLANRPSPAEASGTADAAAQATGPVEPAGTDAPQAEADGSSEGAPPPPGS